MSGFKNLFAVLSTLIISLSLPAQYSRDSLTDKADTLLSDAINKGIFSGVVVITRDGKEIYKKEAGYADWRTQKAISDSTLYNIGSIGKQFTEEMIRQLAKEGRLAYDSPLSKYLSLFPPETGNKITIQQLLDMRSGLGDYFGSPEFRRIEQTDFSLNDLLNIIKNQPLLFEPGTGQQYSNSGYAVLGAVIEKVTGKSYEENLHERIAVPLKLTDIYYTRAEKAAKANRAFGYMIDFEGNKITTDDISNSQPAGGVYTNVHDLLIFTEAKGNNLLPSGYRYRLPGTFAGGTPQWNAVISFGNNGVDYVVMCNMGESAVQIAQRIGAILKGGSYPPFSYPFVVTLYKIIQEKGTDYIRQNIRALCAQDRKPYDDHFLNFYGYQFLQKGKTDIAIALFAINVTLFPDTANVYDSLAEAYLMNGDKENARKNYAKVLELDPANIKVKNILKKLGD